VLPASSVMAALIAYLRSPSGPLAGLDDQREAVQGWAAKKRHRIVGVFEDDMTAGLEQRPALASAMAALGQDAIDGVVVCQLASLDADLVVQEQLLAEIGRLGARVYSLSPGEAAELRRTPLDPSRQVVRQVLEAAAGNERSMAALRSAARTANGQRQGGSPPFGYRVEDGQLVPDPVEQAALARITELRAEGATLREIARALEAEGHRTKRADRWHTETLRRIAKRAEP
jgi:DNA invertase Pin-like site-specific DNA recombinase